MSGQVIFEIEKTEEKSRLSLNQLQWGMRHSGFFSSPILLSSFTPQWGPYPISVPHLSCPIYTVIAVTLP